MRTERMSVVSASSWTVSAVIVAGAAIVVGGLIATQTQGVADFITKGIALASVVIGFVGAVAGLLKGGQVALRADAGLTEAAVPATITIAGAALLLAGSLRL
jgi:hypothetical protein